MNMQLLIRGLGARSTAKMIWRKQKYTESISNTLLLLKVNAVARVDGICHFFSVVFPCAFGERNTLEKALMTHPNAYLHCNSKITVLRDVRLFSSQKWKPKWFLEELCLVLPGTAYTNMGKIKSVDACQILSVYCQQMVLIKPDPVSTHSTYTLSTSLAPHRFLSLNYESTLILHFIHRERVAK